MDNFLDMGFGNTVILDDVTNLTTTDQIITRLSKLYFNVSCSRNGLGIGVVIESPKSKFHPHAFKLQFECTNNEVE